MRRITILFTVAAMMAVLMSISAGPASARVIFNGGNDHKFDRNGGFVFNNDGDHFFGDRDFNGGGVSFELGDVDNESGDVELENNFEISGNNNNACLGQQQFANTGNFTNQQGVLQSGGGVFVDDDNNHNGFFVRDDDDRWNHNRDWWRHDDDDDVFFVRDRDRDNDRGVFFGDAVADDIEFEGPEITFAPQNETTCDQAVQQSAAASSWDDSSWGW